MTTIKDIAKRAKVSVTSASYALNGTGTISADTRQYILKVAEELNYHPNAFAKNLKRQRSAMIGVFIARFGGSFYDEILEGIHHAVLQTDYELIVCPENRVQRKILTHRQVDGAIIFDLNIKTETITKLASTKLPIVVLDRHLDLDYVLPLLLDNQKGVKEAFNHLYHQGARRIFFVAGADSFDNSERERAFLHEATQHNLNIRCFKGQFTEKSGYEVAQRMIETGDLPQAVFCANDQMAIGLIKALKEHHLRIPDDIAVVGFDNIQIAEYLQPSLSTVGASRFAWGATAAQQLIDFLENTTPFQPHRIPTQLIERQSSSKIPSLTTHQTQQDDSTYSISKRD